MTESLLTISLAGFVAGFIFSMPIAGPISILITSNALKGKKRYCQRATVGSAIADFIYVYVAVYGLTRLYALYKPFIPYVLFAGTLFLFFVGYRIFHSRIDLENISENPKLLTPLQPKTNGGFYTGFMINFFNPTLFFGWLTTSFLTISFVASMGLNTGGLYGMIDRNVREINHIEGKKVNQSMIQEYIQLDSTKTIEKERRQQLVSPGNRYFPMIISGTYALSLSLGSIAWFLLLTYLLTRFRKYVNINLINLIIRILGIILCLIGIFFSYTALRMLMV